MIEATSQTISPPASSEVLKIMVMHTGATPPPVACDEVTAEFTQLENTNIDEPLGFSVLKPGFQRAEAENIHLVFGMDEVNQRLALAVRRYPVGPFQMLNVHQLSVLLVQILSERYPEDALHLVKTIPVTDMLGKMALRNGLNLREVGPQEDVLLAEELHEKREGTAVLVVNENQQFSCWPLAGINELIKLLAEKEIELRKQSKTLLDLLIALYAQHGFYQEKVYAVDMKSDANEKHFGKLMDTYRKTPPDLLGVHKLQHVIDFKKGKSKNIESKKVKTFDGGGQEALKLIYSDNISITITPQSGKMLFFISMSGMLSGKDSYQSMKDHYNLRMIRIMQSLNAITQ